jgi:hypothetical protein
MMNFWIFVRIVLWLLSFTTSEIIALGSALLVLIGVIGEEIADLKVLEEKDNARIKRAVKRSAIGLLLLGLAGDALGIVMGQAEMASLTQTA